MDDKKLKNNSVYIVKNGKMELVDKPLTGFGETIIHWQSNKPIRQEIRYTKPFKDN